MHYLLFFIFIAANTAHAELCILLLSPDVNVLSTPLLCCWSLWDYHFSEPHSISLTGPLFYCFGHFAHSLDPLDILEQGMLATKGNFCLPASSLFTLVSDTA